MQTINFHANCASCKMGEIKAPADVYVTAKIHTDSGKMMPYRAYLCDDHLEKMLCDGLLENVVEVEANLDRLTAKHTGFNTFAELCEKHHNPTIRNTALRNEYNAYMKKNKLPHKAYA